MRISVVAGTAFATVLILASNLSEPLVRAQQRPWSGQRWEYGQSVSVRLRILSQPPLADVRKVRCAVEGPDGNPAQPSVRSTTEREFRGGEFIIYFPEDFGRRALAGRYEWTCAVEDNVRAFGAFEYLADDTATAAPNR